MKKLVTHGCSFLKFLAAPLLLFCTGTVLAQQIGPSVLNLDDVTTEYPRPWDREALVVLDFTVKSDGSIDDLKVVDGFYEDRFVDAAIAAARQLRFEPASERGEAVDWPGFRLSTRFIIRNMFHTMGPNPNSELTRAEDLMRENKANEAEALLEKALTENTHLYFEDAVFHLRLGEIYLATNRPAQAVHSLDRAAQTYLPDEHNDFNLETAITHNRIFVVNIPEIFTDDFMSTRLQVHHMDNAPRKATPAPLRGGADRERPKVHPRLHPAVADRPDHFLAPLRHREVEPGAQERLRLCYIEKTGRVLERHPLAPRLHLVSVVD